jgi:hypothetical protein
MNDTSSDILKARLTLPALADMLGRSTSWIRDIRKREPRFPSPDAAGRYRVVAVVQLLHLRDMEQMTDLEFNSEERDRRANVLTAFDPGGALACLAGARSRIAGCPLRTRQEAIDAATQEFERFSRGR